MGEEVDSLLPMAFPVMLAASRLVGEAVGVEEDEEEAEELLLEEVVESDCGVARLPDGGQNEKQCFKTFPAKIQKK